MAFPDSTVTCDANVACGQPKQRGQHLADLVGVVVDGLLAEQHQLRLLLVDQRLEQLGHCERLQFDIRLDEHATIRADRHRRAQRFLACLHAAGHRDHLGRDTRFLHAHSLFHADFVERVHRHLHVRDIDGAAVGLDANPHVRVHDALDRYQYFHRLLRLF